jgi:KaiC/GvpD/RAD55 family RecA-like ATPase
MVDRIASGIPGLDELIQGGFVENSVILVSGSAGTGKTIFCSQFLWDGLENDESCLFVTLEEDPEEIQADAMEFGWDFEEHGDRFNIIYLNPFKDSGGFADRIRSEVERIDASRVVIDSTSVMGMYDENPGRIRERLYSLVRMLRQKGVTAVVTSEIRKGEEDSISRYGVEEFVCDAVIILHYMGIGAGIYRNIEVPKIRKTNQKKGTFPMMIGKDGINVFEDEEEYAAAQDG